MRSRLEFFICAFAALCPLIAGAAGTINGFSLPGYVLPGYVIAADAVDGDVATNRHRIDTQCSVTVTTAGSYRIDWELLDPGDTVVLRSNSIMGMISTVPDTRTVSGFLTPSGASPLQIGVGYRLRVKLHNITTGVMDDTGTQTTGRTFIHMLGTDPASSALNAVTEITAVTINREYLLETNVNRTTIPVDVSYTVHRYDDWNAADTPLSVVVNIAAPLIRDDSNAVQASTVSNGLFAVAGVSSFTAGAPKTPFSVTGTRTIQVDPTAILQPTGYRIEPQISHADTVIPLNTITGNTMASAVTAIAHFTGQLNFASVVTHFGSIAGAPFWIPTIPAPGHTTALLRITPNNNSGTVDGFTDHHFGDGTKTINVVLDENGIATYQGDYTSPPFYTSETLDLVRDVTGNNAGTLNGVEFKRQDNITMDETGLHGTVTAYLPVGVGWRTNRYNGLLETAVDFPGADFNQNLQPLANLNIIPGANAFYLCEETKPVLLECGVFVWDLASGEFQAGSLAVAHSVRKPLMDFLASYSASYPESEMASKVSNDHLYNGVTAAANPRVKKGTSGGGELTTVLSSAANNFVTHFPNFTYINWTGAVSFITIENDLIKPNLSVLVNTSPINVVYAQHCQEALEMNCGAELGAVSSLTSATGNLKMTGDGGLHATGTISMAPMSWGAIPNTTPQEFAHKVTTGFTEGNFLMAGTFLRGDQNPLNDPDGPGVLLLTGFDPADLTIAERPESTEYTGGLADYPGMNFRTTGTHDGQSTLQGDPFGPYDLTGRSKYYIRLSGVTGIHEAPDGGFPSTAVIGGYQFGLTKYGFSFLSNEQEDSRTSGFLDLPDPTDFTLDFTELRLSCLGALESFKITGAGTVDSKEFDFWNALFTPYTATFESQNDCEPGAGPVTLVLGFSAHDSHFADRFAGSLGIMPTGDFTTTNEVNIGDVADSVPTRLTLPGAMEMIGTTGESYDFFPAQGAYLNDATGASAGFWSLFGTFDVPFFKDMQVHLHTNCGSLTPSTPDPEVASSIYVMGGWPSNGWEESLKDPFEVSVFDVHHKGHTNTLANYRKTTDNGNEQFLPRVQQLWLGIINFDYPLKWSNSAFNFSGRGPITSDFIVFETQHELVYLDADYTELTFGARYKGLPTINLGNFAFNAIDDATGISSAFVTAAGDKVFGALEHGVDEMAKAVSDKADDLLGKAVDALTAPLLDDLIDDLKVKINSGIYTEAELKDIIIARVGVSSDLTVALNKLGDPIATVDGFLFDLKTRLEKIEQSIDSVIATVTIDPDTGVNLPVEDVANGLLKEVNVSGEDRRVVFEALSKELVSVLSTLVDASSIEEELADLIQDQDATLDSVTSTLTAIKAIVTDVRQQVEGATGLGDEIHDLIASPTIGQANIATITAAMEIDAGEIVLSATTEDLANLNRIANEWREQIAQKIKDNLYAQPVVADIQEAVKERIYDVQASFNEAVDTAFASLNRAIQEALSGVVAGLNTTLSGLQGAFDVPEPPVKAGSISGFAHINGDSLDCLRLDASIEMAVPDAMSLGAYFQIKELDSDGPGTCIPGVVGEKTVEITLGTEDFPLSWAGLKLSESVRADMNIKFGIASALPVSIGGEFEMTSGTINFETFEVYKLAATVMFGATENYIGAAIGTRFGEFDMAGGIFLGRSCDLDPLLLIDPLVASVVPTSSLTGIYAYGEATFPIFGTGTCIFNISAKAGAGVLYFAEGPTYGGRMTLGIYGEALCAVEVGGEVSLAGTKSGDTYNFAGYGRVFGEAGKCPICVKANFQVDFLYTDLGGWQVDY
jgi:hypothetical protein